MPTFNVPIDAIPREMQDAIFQDVSDSVSEDAGRLREDLMFCAQVVNERVLTEEPGPLCTEVGTSSDTGVPVYIDYGAIGQAVVSFAIDARGQAREGEDGNWRASGAEIFESCVWALCAAMRGCGEIAGIFEAARHVSSAMEATSASNGQVSPMIAMRDLMEFSSDLDEFDGFEDMYAK